MLALVIILVIALILMSYKYHKVCQKLKELEQPPANPDAMEDAAPVDVVKTKMMLVGLDGDTVSILKDNLSDEFDIDVVDDSREAVGKATEINPDIIICDYLMKGMPGDTLCRELKSSLTTSHIAVVFLTALSDSSDIVYGLQAGASDYITKPFEINVLRARLDKVLVQKQSVQQDAVGANLDKQENDDIDYSTPIDRKFMDNVNKILAEKIGDSDFTTNDLYRELNMSRTVVYNKLKALTGHAPSDYIRVIRLNKAMKLLRSHEYNVSEVAFQVGYADPKYFSTSFKKQFGISPSKV